MFGAMTHWLGGGMQARALALAALLAGTGSGFPATNSVVWKTGQVDADIDAWPLPKVLDAIASATGWRVFVDPEARYTVSTRFTRLKPGEALSRLLGDLNYALLPQTNGPARLFVYRNSVQDATQLIQPANKPSRARASSPIPNELILKLKPGTDVDKLAGKLGAKVVGRMDGANSYRLQFEDGESAQRARDQLAQSDDVASVDSNFTIERPPQLEPLAMSSAPPLALHPGAASGSGQTIVGLIDTMVQAGAPNIGDFLLQPMSLYGESSPASDQPTHGTSMAETILRSLSQLSKDSDGTPVRILPVDIYGPNDSTTTFDVARGIAAAINAGATVINLSLGTEGSSPYLQRLIEDASKQGVLFIGAAGNQPLTTPVYPAAYPEVLAVTAGDRRGRIAPYANRGDFVDVVAPGANVIYFGDRAYLGTGTSFSAAYVSGMAAGLVSSGKTPAEATAEIRQQLAVIVEGKK
jgi:hypothetical protein